MILKNGRLPKQPMGRTHAFHARGSAKFSKPVAIAPGIRALQNWLRDCDPSITGREHSPQHWNDPVILSP
jgi:hypothetical protein